MPLPVTEDLAPSPLRVVLASAAGFDAVLLGVVGVRRLVRAGEQWAHQDTVPDGFGIVVAAGTGLSALPMFAAAAVMAILAGVGLRSTGVRRLGAVVAVVITLQVAIVLTTLVIGVGGILAQLLLMVAGLVAVAAAAALVDERAGGRDK